MDIPVLKRPSKSFFSKLFLDLEGQLSNKESRSGGKLYLDCISYIVQRMLRELLDDLL